jgi:hypothetical protein
MLIEVQASKDEQQEEKKDEEKPVPEENDKTPRSDTSKKVGSLFF